MKFFYSWQEFDEDIGKTAVWARSFNFDPVIQPRLPQSFPLEREKNLRIESQASIPPANSGQPKKLSRLIYGVDSIYGIPRGGLMAAVSLSHRLNLPLRVKIEEINEKTLVVDDISDSGKTLEKFEAQLSFKPTVATLFYTSTKNSGVYSQNKSRSALNEKQCDESKGICSVSSQTRQLAAELLDHQDSSRKPDFYAREKTQWVVFPWETEGSSKYDGTAI